MGYLFLVFAYTLYGMSDAVGLLSYAMGSNAYNLAFLNSALPLPIIVGIMCLTKQNIRFGKRTLFVAVFLGALSATATLTMNLSYVMIGVSMGTMLHMSHTLVTTFGEAAILKRRPALDNWTYVCSFVIADASAVLHIGHSGFGGAFIWAERPSNHIGAFTGGRMGNLWVLGAGRKFCSVSVCAAGSPPRQCSGRLHYRFAGAGDKRGSWRVPAA